MNKAYDELKHLLMDVAAFSEGRCIYGEMNPHIQWYENHGPTNDQIWLVTEWDSPGGPVIPTIKDVGLLQGRIAPFVREMSSEKQDAFYFNLQQAIETRLTKEGDPDAMAKGGRAAIYATTEDWLRAFVKTQSQHGVQPYQLTALYDPDNNEIRTLDEWRKVDDCRGVKMYLQAHQFSGEAELDAYIGAVKGGHQSDPRPNVEWRTVIANPAESRVLLLRQPANML